MKKSITEYIKNLSSDEDEIEILEEIIDYKYKKFLALYWLIRDYSDDIRLLKYKKTKKDTLKLEVVIDTDVIEKIYNELVSSNSDDHIQIVNSGKSIKIEIIKDEDYGIAS